MTEFAQVYVLKWVESHGVVEKLTRPDPGHPGQAIDAESGRVYRPGEFAPSREEALRMALERLKAIEVETEKRRRKLFRRRLRLTEDLERARNATALPIWSAQ